MSLLIYQDEHELLTEKKINSRDEILLPSKAGGILPAVMERWNQLGQGLEDTAPEYPAMEEGEF